MKATALWERNYLSRSVCLLRLVEGQVGLEGLAAAIDLERDGLAGGVLVLHLVELIHRGDGRAADLGDDVALADACRSGCGIVCHAVDIDALGIDK